MYESIIKSGRVESRMKEWVRCKSGRSEHWLMMDACSDVFIMGGRAISESEEENCEEDEEGYNECQMSKRGLL